MIVLLVLSLVFAVCQADLCHSESRISCSCRNGAGKQLYKSTHHKIHNNYWITVIKGANCSCNSQSALDLWNDITAAKSLKEECNCTTPLPPNWERPSEYEMINKGYTRQGSSLYKFHNVGQRWDNARRTCQSEGAHLAIINSADEAKILEMLFAQYPNVKNSADNAFALVGFHDQFTEGIYLTIFGEPIAAAGYSDWELTNPSNGGKNYAGHPGENCGSVNRKGKLNDVSCGLNYGFFCELEDGYYPPISEINYRAGYYTGVESVIKPPPGKVKRKKPSSGYSYYPGFGFYKMHSRTDIWENARRICESEDAHLAIINSQGESDLLSKIYSGHPTIYDTTWNDFAFIGFHDQFTEGEFVTIYNETLQSTGFTKWWATYEPNNLGASDIYGGEDCGGVHRNGGLNDLPCDMRHAFICEQSELM